MCGPVLSARTVPRLATKRANANRAEKMILRMCAPPSKASLISWHLAPSSIATLVASSDWLTLVDADGSLFPSEPPTRPWSGQALSSGRLSARLGQGPLPGAVGRMRALQLGVGVAPGTWCGANPPKTRRARSVGLWRRTKTGPAVAARHGRPPA
jgi:hypothetical protein